MRSPTHSFAPRRRFLRTLAVLLAFATILAVAGSAQELRLSGLNGQVLTRADLEQGNVVVVAWASWSPRSRGIAQRVNGVVQRLGGKARVYTVNFQEDPATVQAFLAGNGFNAPVFLDTDGSFAKRYSLANLPGLLVLKNGVDVYHGKLPDDPGELLNGLLD